MIPTRIPFVALGASFFLTAALALSPVVAGACPGEKGAACACGKGAAEAHAEGHDAAGGCAGEAKAEDGKAAEMGHAGCGAAGEHASCGGGAGSPCTCAKAGAEGGGCACGGGCGEALAAPGTKPESNAGGSGSKQMAIIDPATGEIVEPTREQAEAAVADTAFPREAAGSPRQVAQPGGGVMVAFPKEHTSNAVATLDEAGKPHTACAE